jgi:hypothetical protein
MIQSVPLPRHLGGLIAAAAIANATAAAATLFIPDVLTGPAVTNGNARGTTLVMLAIGIPVLTVATWLAARGSWRAIVVVLGTLGYFAYNDFLLLFATPFNSLFLVYVAAIALTSFAVGAVVLTMDPRTVAARCPHVPARGIASYLWVIAGLNVLLWLGKVVPAMLAPDPTAFVAGTGVATNPVIVEDLVFWLPAAALIAALLWDRRPLGILLSGAWLVYWFIEAIGVATDQWFGTMADPTSRVASMEAVVLFIALAVIGLVPLFFFFRPDRGAESAAPAGRTGAGLGLDAR